MSTDILQLIAYVFLVLGFSFLCSVAEAVLLNVTPLYSMEIDICIGGYPAILKKGIVGISFNPYRR